MTLYSHSRLSTFEKCRKQFYFRYVLQIPQETEGIEAFVGKRVHEVLERLYGFVARRQVPSLRRVVDRYHAMFDDHWDAERVVIVKEGLDVDHYREVGVRCLENHYRDQYPFDQDETLGVEERVVFPLDPAGRYRVQGFVDRVVRARDGAVEIHDYKTGEYVPGQRQLDGDRQLALYQIGLQERFGEDVPVRLVWHYLSRGVTRVSTRTPDQLADLKRDTMTLIDRIESEKHYPTSRTKLCSWCSYKSVCPAWGAPESAAAEAAARGDGTDEQLSLL